MRVLGILGPLLLLGGGGGCAPSLPGGFGTGPASLPTMPGDGERCRVAASQSNPLVTEWSASEKANLEALLRSGAVAVAYSGCSMKLLPQCQLRGQYGWQRTTPSTDSIEIDNADQLYAKLPLGAASLEGELKRSGRLAVRTFISGQMKLAGVAPDDVPSEGVCAQATHLLGALSVGAFYLTSGASVSGGASATVASLAEAGVGAERNASLLRSAGNPDSCSGGNDGAPHPDCASPIQVFLWPLPGRAAEEGPPGTIRASFVSANAASRWEVYADDEVLCSTPCTRWVDPNRPVLMRSREDAFGSSDRISLLTLHPHAEQGPLQVQAQGTQQGKLVTGITFTTFAGMGVITGIALTGIGCGGDTWDGLCTPGLITMFASGAALAGALWLMLDALPRAHIQAEAALYARPAPGPPPGGLRFGPGFVSGTF